MIFILSFAVLSLCLPLIEKKKKKGGGGGENVEWMTRFDVLGNPRSVW